MEKFNTAEQLWFWFVYSKCVRTPFSRTFTTTKRPCELMDVEILITKLYLSGKITREQLEIMRLYADKRRSPNPNIYTEFRHCILWDKAMATIEHFARLRGWIYPKETT